MEIELKMAQSWFFLMLENGLGNLTPQKNKKLFEIFDQLIFWGWYVLRYSVQGAGCRFANNEEKPGTYRV